MMKISTVEARENFAELINRAAYGKNRIVLTRRGKPLAAVVPISDFEQLPAEIKSALQGAADQVAE